MNIETLTELIPTLKSAIGLVIPLAFLLTGLRMIARVVSEGTTDSLLDCVLEWIGDLIEHIKSMFRKPQKQDPITTDIFRMRFDDGLFNKENYNSNNRTDG